MFYCCVCVCVCVCLCVCVCVCVCAIRNHTKSSASERAKRASSVPVHVNRDFRYIYICGRTSTSTRMPGKSLLLATNCWTLSTDYACSYDCIIKEGGASYRTLWIVHSHYRGTVKSKYVDIAISFAQPSQDSQLDQFYPPN